MTSRKSARGLAAASAILPAALILTLAAACSESGQGPGQDTGPAPPDQALFDQTPRDIRSHPETDFWPRPYDIHVGDVDPPDAMQPDINVNVDKDKDGWTIGKGDCDDNDPKVYPGSTQHQEGVDYDCDGLREYKAVIEIIVDDKYARLCHNDKDIATNVASWQDSKVERYERVMEAGANVIGVHGQDVGSVAAAAAVRIRVAGRVYRTHGTDPKAPDTARWRYFPKATSQPRAGWCSPAFNDKAPPNPWGPAILSNEEGNGVWLPNPRSFRTSRTDWVWDGSPRSLKDSWLRIKINLPNTPPLSDPVATKPSCTLGTKVVLASATGKTGYEPFVGTDGSNAMVSWTDLCCGWRTGDWEIFAAKLSPTGTVITNPVRLTNYIWWGRRPALAYNGSGYGLPFEDARSVRDKDAVYLMVIDNTPKKLATEKAMTSSSYTSKAPRAAWNGSEYGLVWQDDRNSAGREIYFSRVSASGSKVGTELRVTSALGASTTPEILWNGTEYAVFWVDTRDTAVELYFARISVTGIKVGTDVRLTTTAGETAEPSVVFANGGYAVAYEDDAVGDNHEIFLLLMDTKGKVNSRIQVTKDQGVSLEPSLTFDGTNYAVAWLDSRSGEDEILMARLSKTGVKLGKDEQLTKKGVGRSSYPSLAWIKGAKSYLLAWQQQVSLAPSGTRDEVHAAAVTCK
jgi:hypothetical protein